MSTVTEFLNQQPARRGKLGQWEDEIVALRQAGASYLCICRFLAQQGVVARSGEVYRFMQRCGRQDLVKSPAQRPSRPAPPPGPPAPPAPDGLPKFDWDLSKPKPPW